MAILEQGVDFYEAPSVSVAISHLISLYPDTIATCEGNKIELVKESDEFDTVAEFYFTIKNTTINLTQTY